jgi:H+/Cl- antiporter ClcA
MIAPIFYGLISAAGVSLVSALASTSDLGPLLSQSIPIRTLALLVALAFVVSLVQWFGIKRAGIASEGDLQRYDGLPDLLIHLHSPALPDRSRRWAFRSFTSWILSSLGFAVGPEGGASEMVQAVAMRSRSAALRWSDLARRSDAAMALSAGIAAAFGAPFAAVLVASELAIGGRVLSSVLAALSAYLSTGYFSKLLSSAGISVFEAQERLAPLWGFDLLDWRQWLLAIVLVVCVSVFASFGLLGLGQVRELIEGVAGRFGKFQAFAQAFAMTWVSAILLGSLVVLAPEFLVPMPMLFDRLLQGGLGLWESVQLLAVLFLTLAALGSGMGSMGIWWPTFLAGATLSYLLVRGFAGEILPAAMTANAAMIGAVAFGSVWLRTPISLAVLAFEFTQNGTLLLPALLAATVGRWVDQKLGRIGWVDQLLVSKGFPIVDGRALAVLKSLKVGAAMVTNFETVGERESIRSCHEKILSCHYPFLPVVDSAGLYRGLLTVDLIEAAMEAAMEESGQHSGSAAHERLEGLLEAKDLLYRSGIEVPSVQVDQSLAGVKGALIGQSCLPVVDSESKVVGLLFAHDVRQCYDREVARLSFVIRASQSTGWGSGFKRTSDHE